MITTHAQRLERWLGPTAVQSLVDTTKNLPRNGPPIAIAGVPGHVYAKPGGEFVGAIRGGYFGNAVDFAEQRVRRIVRNFSREQLYRLHAGFTSYSDLVAEATSGGKSQQLLFQKAPTTGTTVGNCVTARNIGTLPAARGVGGTSGTGVKCVNTTTGALNFQQPSGGDYTHITTITMQASVAGSLMMFDCLWDMTYNHASSTSTAIDAANRPDRYQTAALAPGNFIGTEITTALSATAHNITVTYVDQDGNTAEAAAAYAAAVSAVALRANTPAFTWFVTLNSGDTGARYLTNIAQSTTASVTGVSTFFIGHPLALVPIPSANVPFIYDGIHSAFTLERVYDAANLSFMNPSIAGTGTTVYYGLIRLVQG